MKTMVFRGVPQLVEEDKKQNASNIPVEGNSVVDADLARMLLMYGTYERYYFFCGMPQLVEESQRRLALYPNSERAEIILADDFGELKHMESLLMFTSSTLLHDFLHLRKCIARYDWPAVGITHSLSHVQGLPYVLFSLLQDFYKYDCLICTSQGGQKAVKNLLEEWRVHLRHKFGAEVDFPVQLPIIPLGIDTALYRKQDKAESRWRLGIPGDQIVFLCLGRLSTAFKMDVAPLLLAFSQTLPNKKRWSLILAGDDTLHRMAPELESLAGELGCAEQVKVFPDITFEEKLALYSAADVFLSPSDNVQETFGLTIIEAMASGLPVIASDWDGYRETVEPGKTGFLVPTYWANCVEKTSKFAMARGDAATHWLLGQSIAVDLDALVNYMSILAENAQLRQDMGDAAVDRASCYNWPVIIGRYEEVWAELLTQAKTHGEADKGEFEYGIGSYDYLKVFNHYPTEILKLDCVLRTTAMGCKFLGGALKIKALEKDMLAFRQNLNRRLADACDCDQGVQMANLVAGMKIEDGETQELIVQHVMRLMKYGILELCSGSRVNCQTEADSVSK